MDIARFALVESILYLYMHIYLGVIGLIASLNAPYPIGDPPGWNYHGALSLGQVTETHLKILYTKTTLRVFGHIFILEPDQTYSHKH